jgi:hypothetical protein
MYSRAKLCRVVDIYDAKREILQADIQKDTRLTTPHILPPPCKIQQVLKPLIVFGSIK